MVVMDRFALGVLENTFTYKNPQKLRFLNQQRRVHLLLWLTT